jgi:Protein of unknown function DUF262
MASSSPQTSVKPDIVFLTDLIDQIAKGELRVPRFQRPYVWKPEDMTSLFESILNGYPIGSLLFWKTEGVYNTFDKIGPIKVERYDNTPLNYILDGHQRLSTLFGILYNLDSNQYVNDIEPSWQWKIYYDLKEKKFLHLPKKDSIVLPYYIELKKILKTTDFLSECRKIMQKFDNEISARYIEQAEQLLKSIRGYKIAITQIEGGDLDSAVRIFSLLNTTGMKMDDDRMYSALTYKENEFNLSDRLDSIQEQLFPCNFDTLDRTILFRIILAAANKDIYTSGKLDLFDNTKDLPNIVDEAEQAILKTADFLYNRLNIPSAGFLPYSLQFLVLSEFFRLCPKPSENKLQHIEQWFWVSSFVGIDNVNTSIKVHTINEMREFARAEDSSVGDFKFRIVDFNESASPFPLRYNLISARIKAFVLFLSTLQPRSLENGEIINVKDILAKNGYKSILYIKNTYRQKELVSRNANRLITDIEKGVFKYLKIQNDGLFNTYDSVLLNSHAITKEAFDALMNDNEDLFIELREQELIRLEIQFLKNKGVVPYNNDATTEESVNDSDTSSEL